MLEQPGDKEFKAKIFYPERVEKLKAQNQQQPSK